MWNQLEINSSCFSLVLFEIFSELIPEFRMRDVNQRFCSLADGFAEQIRDAVFRYNVVDFVSSGRDRSSRLQSGNDTGNGVVLRGGRQRGVAGPGRARERRGAARLARSHDGGLCAGG